MSRWWRSKLHTTYTVLMNYRNIISQLSACYDPGEARAITRMVLERRFALLWTDVLCDGIETMSEKDKAELTGIIGRIADGEPVQYVLGEAEFCARIFHVEPRVLIPRIETEELITQVLASIYGCRQPLRIMDIGTGSGCIAISIDKALEETNTDYVVDAIDISADAIRIAKGNATQLGATHTNFIKTDILNEAQTALLSTDYSVIVSNPPYICNKERAEMDSHVIDHEPHSALFVPDNDPLLFYKAITHFAKGHLLSGGKLLFEINRAYGEETADVLRSYGFQEVAVIKDQFGNDRIVKGLLP